MSKHTKEAFLVAISLLPLIYLRMVWNKLPETVATHFNIRGEADDWSSRQSLIYLPGLLGVGIYLLMAVIPSLDPKKKLQEMGEKYFLIRLITILFISLLSIYLMYIATQASIKEPRFLFLILGGFFAVFGNYLQTVRPNYFVGIRTPWTLESEEVWKSTHRLGGKIWMVGGVLIVLLSILMKLHSTFDAIFLSIIGVMVLVPIVFSYLEYKRNKAL